MAGINGRRFILAGLAAGVVMNVISVLSWGFYAQEMIAILKARDIVPPKGSVFMAIYFLMRFTWGFVAVWFYTMARARYGPGVKTAVSVGFIYWLGGALLAVISYGMLGLFPVGMLAVWAVIMLVATMLSTIFGAWIYREG